MSADNRDYYRLEDDIQISFKRVTDTDAKIHDADDFLPKSAVFQLSKSLYGLEMEAVEILHQVHDQNRPLANLFTNINKRIELLSRAMISSVKDEQTLNHSHSEISEGGLSFTTHEPIEAGQVLAFRLVFQPSLLGISCFAVVKHCHQVSKEVGNKIGTSFIEMDQITKRLLSRHIIRRQAEIRRNRLKRKEIDSLD